MHAPMKRDPGDTVDTERHQLARLRSALDGERHTQVIDFYSWKVGHHAGRIFAMRERESERAQ